VELYLFSTTRLKGVHKGNFTCTRTRDYNVTQKIEYTRKYSEDVIRKAKHIPQKWLDWRQAK
jgi:hypothetical protein